MPRKDGLLRWMQPVPNLITAGRIACAPVLLWLAFTHQETAFGVVLVAALVSDIVDGLIARACHATSAFGAALDSVADSLLVPVAALGAWVFHADALHEHFWALLTVVGLALAENAVALLRYGRLSSFHTYLSRAAAYALGIFVGSLFVFGFVPWLMWLAVVLALVAHLEEFLLLWRLPTWRSDVRGLWWVMHGR
jgi:CDP-diacylglycerol--glycerol-3-phosphate 3-phosphatidyltransferase